MFEHNCRSFGPGFCYIRSYAFAGDYQQDREEKIMRTRWLFCLCSILCAILCVVLTQNTFAQWTHVDGPAKDVTYLSANGSDMFAQTSTGFFYSTDYGSHWSYANSGFADSLAGAFAADSANFLLANVLNQLPPLPGGINLGGAGLDYSSLAALVLSLSILYPQTYVDSIYVSLDTGSTALRLSQILSSLALYAAGLDTTDILSQINPAELQISLNGGKDWISVEEALSTVSVRAVAKTDNYVFAATNRGVFRANANASNWSQANYGLPDTNVHALAVMSPWLFAGTEGGVFFTTDNGNTWRDSNVGLTNKHVLALAAVGNHLFAGTRGGGVFSSIGKWKAVNTGLSYLTVNALAISNDVLFAGTTGGGLWKRPVSQMITAVDAATSTIPERFALFQNYPNPFNPSTVITYQLPASGVTTLKVYDVLGREVETLVNERQNAGSFSVLFNAHGLSSGVYFYRLQAGTFSETKMLLLLQ
jgi:Secretion system C-terminal sorting domain